LGALTPVLTVLNFIPYLGMAMGLVLTTFFIVAASIEVHGIASRKAWVVFGVIGAIMIFGTVGMEIAARQLARQAEVFRIEVEKAGKQMQEQTEQFQKQAEQFEKLAKDAERAMQEQMKEAQKSAEESRGAMEREETGGTGSGR
jgi:Sec-independent protein translocase protein TatA